MSGVDVRTGLGVQCEFVIKVTASADAGGAVLARRPRHPSRLLARPRSIAIVARASTRQGFLGLRLMTALSNGDYRVMVIRSNCLRGNRRPSLLSQPESAAVALPDFRAPSRCPDELVEAGAHVNAAGGWRCGTVLAGQLPATGWATVSSRLELLAAIARGAGLKAQRVQHHGVLQPA